VAAVVVVVVVVDVDFVVDVVVIVVDVDGVVVVAMCAIMIFVLAIACVFLLLPSGRRKFQVNYEKVKGENNLQAYITRTFICLDKVHSLAD